MAIDIHDNVEIELFDGASMVATPKQNNKHGAGK